MWLIKFGLVVLCVGSMIASIALFSICALRGRKRKSNKNSKKNRLNELLKVNEKFKENKK